MADTNEALQRLEDTLEKIRRQEGLKTNDDQAIRDIFSKKVKCPDCGREFDANSMFNLFGFL